MPFTAECSFCRLQIQRVPDNRDGASLECPRCGNAFTLAGMSRPSHDPTPIALPAGTARAFPAAIVFSARAKISTIQSGAPTSALSGAARTTGPANPFGLVAFFLASLSFLSLSFPGAGSLTVPLAGAAVVLAGATLASARLRSRGVVAASLAVVASTGVLAAAVYQGALSWPFASQENPLSGSDAQVVIHLRDQGVDRHPEPRKEEWVNASRDALQQGDVRIRIASVYVETVAPTERSALRRVSEQRLVIRLRVSNAGAERLVPYTGWGKSADLVLRDSDGRTYPGRSPTSRDIVRPVGSAEIPPGKWVDDVLLFDAPLTSAGPLRLELPAAAIGAEGKLQFQIPRTMVRNGPDAAPGKRSK